MKTEKDLLGCLEKLNKLCRVCLCESNMKSKSYNPYWETLFRKVMSDMHIEFLVNDVLPSEICDNCCTELEVADRFRAKCENSNGVLKSIFKQYFVKNGGSQLNDTDETPSMDDDVNLDGFDEEPPSKDVENTKKAKKKTPLKKNKATAKDKQNANIINDSVETGVVDKSGWYVCDICNKQLKCKQSIERHITLQHSAEKMVESNFKAVGLGAERRFHCLECPYTTRTRTPMRVHSRVHTGYKPYVCDVCSNRFTQRNSLNTHKLSHLDSKQFICQDCGKQFKDQKSLRYHQTVHSTELNFVCGYCNKETKTKRSLKHHMQRHSQMKNFSCEFCGSTFYSKTELINHKHLHTKVKRFFCTQCDYGCHWRKSLLIHTRRHRKDKTVQCEMCEYMCYTNSQLKTHQRKHSGEKNYPCPICGERFKQSSSFNKHVQVKHKQKLTWSKMKVNSCV